MVEGRKQKQLKKKHFISSLMGIGDWVWVLPVSFLITELRHNTFMQGESKIATIIEKLMGAIVFVLLVWLMISAIDELILKLFL